MIELIFPGLLAGFLLTFSTSLLGSFIVWRRMSSFGDTLSHSSLLGFAISIFFNLNAFYTVLFFISFLAIMLVFLKEFLPLSSENILSITSHSSLSLGMVVMSMVSNNQSVDINSYLFGDLLTVTKSDLIIIFLGNIFVISILLFRWNSLLLATINEELAKIDGINLYYDRLAIMLTTAVTMSIAIKFVGALLVTSLLIIPPAIAKNFSGSPEKMVIVAIIFSILSIIGGVYLSIFCHTPTSPSIVLFLSFFYFLSNFKKYFFS